MHTKNKPKLFSKTIKKGKLFLFFWLIILGPQALATHQTTEHLIISEVLYNPLTIEAGGEAVQLHNPSSSSVDLSGYVLRTTTSSQDATLPAFPLCAGCSFLVADAGWSEDKDNPSWPNADYEEALSLANTKGGVALVFQDTIIDAVGWGNIEDSELFEGTPLALTREGNSIRRTTLADTNNNSADFVEGIPLWKGSTQIAETPEQTETNTTNNDDDEGTVTLEFTVTNVPPVIEALVVEDDDSSTSSIEITPSPGATRSVEVTVFVSDENGDEDVQQASIEVTNNEGVQENFTLTTTEPDVFMGSLKFPYYYSEGEYDLTVTVEDQAGTTNTLASSLYYQGIIGLSLDTHALAFSQQDEYAFAMGDANMSSSALSLQNIGNTPLDLGVSGTELSNGESVIPQSAIEYTFTDFEDASTLSSALALTPFGLPPQAITGLSFRLFIPEQLSAGVYNGQASVVGVAQ
jgi:hypothetical protein